MESKTIHPNDKAEAMASENYEIYKREVIRLVFPRIFRESNEANTKAKLATGAKKVGRLPEIRDVVAFYFYILSYVNGQAYRESGEPNEKYGACFVSYKRITEDLCMTKDRIKYLADVLEANGLIIRSVHYYEGAKRYKLYYPSWSPRVSDDGYLVNPDGEKIIPDQAVYLPRRD
ncbi:hypothetical protein [Thermoactinomyces sp. DSM 45892]|uniref:hypothetical protein n=1 Tax=Thermoactinomyces sp. DSM 45892 TaxID=1882753 RepID=UPI000897EB94|nr:hypothetical protein [Thermoactinomyces sp. DSM 45892]SDY45817.1 hypothetical protein SAMN05444416_1051 [Thermoactinomyces sp. DSM 45892]